MLWVCPFYVYDVPFSEGQQLMKNYYASKVRTEVDIGLDWTLEKNLTINKSADYGLPN